MKRIVTTTKGHTITVWQDPDYDYTLSIRGARTLRRYYELRDKAYKLPVGEYGLFFAFSKKQYAEGYQGLVDRGLIQDGEKVSYFGNGCYGTKAGLDRWIEESDKLENAIREECDPYEVYLEEYNNYECCIDWDGDERAVSTSFDFTVWRPPSRH